MDTGRTEIINPIEVVVNQLCMYIKAGDFENASVMAKLIPADYKEFDLVKAYAWAMGGYFQGGNTPEETQRAADQVRQAAWLYAWHSHRDHSDGILRVAARIVCALAALVYPRDRPVPRRQAHAAHPHRAFHACLPSGLRL